MLEIIAREPESPTKRPPLLLVHGFWHAAWSWDEFVMPYLVDRGYACYAPDLRGHGASPGREQLRWTRIRDYVDDLADTAARLSAEPVLIGASAGGFVVQKYLERHTAAGAVLVAPIPPSGAFRTMVHVARHYPRVFLKANLSLSLAPVVATPELARAHFFSAAMSDEQVRSYQSRMQDDSYRAFLDLVALDLVRTRRVRRTPMLVLGAEDDTLVSPRQVRRTAERYGAEVEILPGIAHDMMLDSRWRTGADRMVAWLDNTFPT